MSTDATEQTENPPPPEDFDTSQATPPDHPASHEEVSPELSEALNAVRAAAGEEDGAQRRLDQAAVAFDDACQAARDLGATEEQIREHSAVSDG